MGLSWANSPVRAVSDRRDVEKLASWFTENGSAFSAGCIYFALAFKLMCSALEKCRFMSKGIAALVGTQSEHAVKALGMQALMRSRLMVMSEDVDEVQENTKWMIRLIHDKESFDRLGTGMSNILHTLEDD